jgi:hypothetical protein
VSQPAGPPKTPPRGCGGNIENNTNAATKGHCAKKQARQRSTHGAARRAAKRSLQVRQRCRGYWPGPTTSLSQLWPSPRVSKHIHCELDRRSRRNSRRRYHHHSRTEAMNTDPLNPNKPLDDFFAALIRAHCLHMSWKAAEASRQIVAKEAHSYERPDAKCPDTRNE